MASYPQGTELTEAETYEHLHEWPENRTVDQGGRAWRVRQGKLLVQVEDGWNVRSQLYEMPHRVSIAIHPVPRLQQKLEDAEARIQHLEAAIRAAAELVTR